MSYVIRRSWDSSKLVGPSMAPDYWTEKGGCGHWVYGSPGESSLKYATRYRTKAAAEKVQIFLVDVCRIQIEGRLARTAFTRGQLIMCGLVRPLGHGRPTLCMNEDDRLAAIRHQDEYWKFRAFTGEEEMENEYGD